jgi:hypothetical protein
MKVRLCARYEGTGGLEVRIHSFFFFTLDGSSGLASCIDHFSSVKRATVNFNKIVGPRTPLEIFERKKNLLLLPTIRVLFIL